MRQIQVCGMVVGLAASAAMAQASLVWQSTFDSNADGVANIYTGNGNEVMIGPVTAGHLQITTQDNGGAYAYTPNRAGRLLGTAQGGADSFSGLYRFNWSSLNTSASQIPEEVGFIGNSPAQSRQFVGGLLRHYVDGNGNYLVGLDVAFGGSGNFATSSGPLSTEPPYTSDYAVNLGSNPLGTNYQLAVGWDGATRTVTLALYDAQGNLLGEHSGVVSATGSLPVWPTQPSVDSEVASLSVTNLGWSDYTTIQSNKTAVWNVDSLGYYNTAAGAFTAAVPEPGTLSALGGLALLAIRRRRK